MSEHPLVQDDVWNDLAWVFSFNQAMSEDSTNLLTPILFLQTVCYFSLQGYSPTISDALKHAGPAWLYGWDLSRLRCSQQTIAIEFWVTERCSIAMSFCDPKENYGERSVQCERERKYKIGVTQMCLQKNVSKMQLHIFNISTSSSY